MHLAPNAAPQDMRLATAAPSIEITQSLWQNAFGRGIDLQRQAAVAQTRSQKADIAATQKSLEVDAKAKFWTVWYLRRSASK